jgi:hypothetical protein
MHALHAGERGAAMRGLYTVRKYYSAGR